jgi:hypothetical protein
VLTYARRESLHNNSDLLLIDNPNKLFSPNQPFSALVNDSLFPTNNAFTAEFSFLIRFNQKYYSLPDQKIIIGTKYPKINITYKKAMPLAKGDANFDLLGITINDDINLGLLGKLSYRIKGGQFVNYQKIYFNDFKHFTGNQTIINGTDYLGSFRLLPYYTYSADRWYVEAHAEHNFKGIVITKLPILKKLAWQEVIGIHYLRNNRLKANYVELNFGIERIFKIIRLDYVMAYTDKMQVKSGITIGLHASF